MVAAKDVTTRRESVGQTIRRLETYIRRFERRYERNSETMANDVERGDVRETAEISRWLSSHRVLKNLETLARNGRTTGTRTKTT